MSVSILLGCIVVLALCVQSNALKGHHHKRGARHSGPNQQKRLVQSSSGLDTIPEVKNKTKRKLLNHTQNITEINVSIVEDYYSPLKDALTQLKDIELKVALKEHISHHVADSYKGLWLDFAVTDINIPGSECTQGQIMDIYTNHCYRPDQHGCDFHEEGDCFNREHSWPKSWWGGFSEGHHAQTDLFHIYPVDGLVNSKRSNYPYGTVDDDRATYTSSSNAKLGPCNVSGYDGICFEPTEKYKGDVARSYFYISTAYHGDWPGVDKVDGVHGSRINDWFETLLKQWHETDPVDEKERTRNDSIHKIQKNRNPFIDMPQLVENISDF